MGSRPLPPWVLMLVGAAALILAAYGGGLLGPVGEGWPDGRDALERRGRDVFLEQGCARCHAGALGSPDDAFDLRTTGAPRSAGWHAMHLFEPLLARAFSTMPASPGLFLPTTWDPEFADDDPPPQLSADGRALVAYLLRLQQLPARAAAVQSLLTPLPDLVGGDDDLYRIWCSLCHGTEGNGDGPGAAFLAGESLPRAFRPGLFRVRSRLELPTDDDLLGVITDGLPGTAMPDFGHLSEFDRRALVGFVQGYARTWEDGEELDPFAEEPREPLPVGEPPPATPALLARGEERMTAMRCAQCHPELSGAPDASAAPDAGADSDASATRHAGADRDAGAGSGASAGSVASGAGAVAVELDWRDEVGRPLPRAPHLLTDRLKGGERPRDLYLRLVTGMAGSPMPAYADALPDEQDRWAVVLALLARRAAAHAPAAP